MDFVNNLFGGKPAQALVAADDSGEFSPSGP